MVKAHTLMKLLLWTLCLYLVYLCFLFVVQRRLVFPRHLTRIPEEPYPVAGLDRSWIQVKDGRVESWFSPPNGDNTSFPVIIFAHGNAELIDYSPGYMGALANRGVGVLLVEYPGYGRSTGSPSQETITDAFVEAYDRLLTREGVDPSRIVFMGHSLGGGVVCALQSRRPSAALILLSTFTGIRALSSKYFSPGFLVRDPFDNLEVVSGYTKPIHITHGEYDSIIPYSHALRLSRTAKDSRLLTYSTDHNDCPPDWPDYWVEVIKFLEEIDILRKD